ncbi:hypothetical protein HMPREF7215_0159 [Pyramidobacter piscolens W5455]|uniref:Uncharacterized protein n=1 Tax=Pyramidobacter piscolens W5455 TaxID=352165 RepID=A0ABP2HPL4_9BACT|nr:hypothetical protein HMPREF7215_0159 [Pyramidobacter piscolens W5455]
MSGLVVVKRKQAQDERENLPPARPALCAKGSQIMTVPK